METPVDQPQLAWQPLTPRGVAAFARASLGRLLLVQLLVALIAGAVAGWFLGTAWFPVVSAATRRLPEQGEIRNGRLDWRGDSPERLAENHFLAVLVDLKHTGAARSPAHVQVEFGEGDFQVRSLFGAVQRGYLRGWSGPFNRESVVPWWGAWSPPILAGAVGATVGGLLLSWALLAALYALPVWLAGFFANRDVSVRGSWRLAGAALMPGALFMSGAVVLYGLGALDLVELLGAGALHLGVGWVYLAASLFCLPRHPAAAAAKQNPFLNR